MKRRHKVSSRDETVLIVQIRRWLGRVSPPPPTGIGDDCAVVRASAKHQLLTVDPVVAGVHFLPETPAATVAAKLLKRNLSDIAAMGGVPRQAVIALAIPTDQPNAWLEAFFRSLGRCARRNGVNIVGGDCSETSGPLVATLTLLGDSPTRPLLRNQARAGDLLYVTGSLGGSILGRHLRFAPRLKEGQWLARRREVHSAMDLSDGLGKDAVALLRPGTRVVIDPRTLPISPAARRHARETSRDPIDCALNDGEDYELLFAAAGRKHARLAQAWRRRFTTRLTCIGRVESHRSRDPAVCFSPPLPPDIEVRGHVHFR